MICFGQHLHSQWAGRRWNESGNLPPVPGILSDGAVAELHDVAVVPGCTLPMALGFASNDILPFITHDPLET
jgi:hypothetical protein